MQFTVEGWSVRVIDVTAQAEEYRATAEPPPAWRHAAAIGAYERMETTA